MYGLREFTPWWYDGDDDEEKELPAEEPWPEPYLPIDEETGGYYEPRF